MRMVHYYLVAVAILVPLLFAAPWSGLAHDGSQRHLSIGLLMAVTCVGANALVILFSITTGRVLKAAMNARPLGPELLEELNQYFARRAAYPVALLGATFATATAVLGYGPNIGVPIYVHWGLGIATVVLNLFGVLTGIRSLRDNQSILDRARVELDQIEREIGPAPPGTGDVDWRVGPASRRAIFASCAWLPYVYWGLIVWRGDFSRVPILLLVATIVVSVMGWHSAWRMRRASTPS